MTLTFYGETTNWVDGVCAIGDDVFFGIVTSFTFAGKALTGLLKYPDDCGIAWDITFTSIPEKKK